MTDEEKQAAADAAKAAATEAAKDDDAPHDTDGAHDYKAGEAKWKAMSRKHEAEAKSNKDAAKKLADMEDADKSEVQKLTDKATASDKAAASAGGELSRLRVAMRKGLTEAQAKRLIGTTEEELEADADALLTEFGDKTVDDKGDKSPTRPKEKMRSGSTNADELSTDPQQRARDYYASAPTRPTRK